MDEPPGLLYKAVIVGLLISYFIIAVTHAPGFAWIIPIPVAAATAILIAVTTRRRQ